MPASCITATARGSRRLFLTPGRIGFDDFAKHGSRKPLGHLASAGISGTEKKQIQFIKHDLYRSVFKCCCVVYA